MPPHAAMGSPLALRRLGQRLWSLYEGVEPVTYPAYILPIILAGMIPLDRPGLRAPAFVVYGHTDAPSHRLCRRLQSLSFDRRPEAPAPQMAGFARAGGKPAPMILPHRCRR